MIDFVCNSCGLIYHADEAHEGKAIRCSQCGTVLPITRAITPEVTRASTASVKMVEEEPKARAILLWQLSWRRRKGMLAIFAAVLAVGVVWLMVSRSPNTEPTRKPENNPVTVSANELEKQPATDSTPPRPAIPEPSNALKNGTRLSKDIGTHGKGILVLRNGNGDDAVVRVIEQHSDTTVRWVYIAAHSDLKLTHIEPGSYLLLFSTGIDWDD